MSSRCRFAVRIIANCIARVTKFAGGDDLASIRSRSPTNSGAKHTRFRHRLQRVAIVPVRMQKADRSLTLRPATLGNTPNLVLRSYDVAQADRSQPLQCTRKHWTHIAKAASSELICGLLRLDCCDV
jgi:hypothetical protein